MANANIRGGIKANWSQQGKRLINNVWYWGDTDKYFDGDMCIYSGTLYYCILEADASSDATQIPTNTTYFTAVAGTQGPAGSAVADITFVDKSNVGTTLGIDFTETIIDGDAHISGTVDASNVVPAEVPRNWASGTTYTEGKIVWNDGNLWEASDSATVGTAPNVDTSNWKILTSAITFQDTVNDDLILGVNFTNTDDVITATVDATNLQGVDGKSVTGYTGTATAVQFINSNNDNVGAPINLRGDDGTDGEIGPRGFTGPAGDATWIDYVGGIPNKANITVIGDTKIVPYNGTDYYREIVKNSTTYTDKIYQTYTDGVLGTLLITRGG